MRQFERVLGKALRKGDDFEAGATDGEPGRHLTGQLGDVT